MSKPFIHALTLDEHDAAAIADGKLTQLILPYFDVSDTFTLKPARYVRARRSDLFWVREPFVEYVARRGMALGIGFGGVGSARPPVGWERRDLHSSRVIRRDASVLSRASSRLTLHTETTLDFDLFDLDAETALRSGIFETLKGYAAFGDVYHFPDPVKAFFHHWKDVYRLSRQAMISKALILRFSGHVKNIGAFVADEAGR